MNDLERRSFYSFLGLYIISSLLFIVIISFWYYTAQKHSLENEIYYKLEHLADEKAGEIIATHMSGKKQKAVEVSKDISMALIDTKGEVTEGKLIDKKMTIRPGYFEVNGYSVLVSDAPREHLNIEYIVLQTNSLQVKLHELKQSVLFVMGLVSLAMMLVAWGLAKLFMRPLRQRIEQIERFINDVTHELNTPITSLRMSSDQALKTGVCSEKTLKNISISSKQLYDIYRSLTYLNFSRREEVTETLDAKEVLKESILYYTPLAEIKRMSFDVEAERTECVVPKQKLTLLLGNLIGNAIKYSPPKSKITIVLKDRVLTIRDEGIGIDIKEQKDIFEKFKRATSYSGGFGVGLNIVKSICDEYGIKIEFDSKLGEGTEFRLYL